MFFLLQSYGVEYSERLMKFLLAVKAGADPQKGNVLTCARKLKRHLLFRLAKNKIQRREKAIWRAELDLKGVNIILRILKDRKETGSWDLLEDYYSKIEKIAQEMVEECERDRRQWGFHNS